VNQSADYDTTQSGAESPGTQSMATAGVRLMSARLAAIRDLERSVRRDQHDAVHDMRVATRRLRVIFPLFRPFYDRGDRSGLEGGLRRLARLLGDIRDMEVMLADCRAASARLEDADLAGFEAKIDERRATGRVRLLAHLGSDDYAEFNRRFDRLFERYGSKLHPRPRFSRGDGHPRLLPTTVASVLPARIWQHYGRIRAYAPFVPTLPNRSLHGLRIAGKRLRYTLEAFEQPLGGELQPLLGPLKAMQDALGTLQDAVVLIDLLQAFESKAGPSDSVAPYAAEKRLQEGEARVEFERLWPGLIDPQFRSDLARAVASL
jgi:CHAD domain-containing protein